MRERVIHTTSFNASGKETESAATRAEYSPSECPRAKSQEETSRPFSWVAGEERIISAKTE